MGSSRHLMRCALALYNFNLIVFFMTFDHLTAMVALSKLVAVTEFLRDVPNPQVCDILDTIVDDFKKVLNDME